MREQKTERKAMESWAGPGNKAKLHTPVFKNQGMAGCGVEYAHDKLCKLGRCWFWCTMTCISFTLAYTSTY